MIFNRLNLTLRTGKYLIGLMAILSIAVICVAFTLADGNDYATAKREILLRKIGHELLLQSGDSVNRVLPVKRITDNTYLIMFEHAFTFRTDSLVNATQQILSKDPLAGDYLVQVLNAEKPGIAYGYAISKDNKDNIITCVGRKQPKARYSVSITFKPARTYTLKNTVLLGGLPFLTFVGFMLFRSVKPGKPLSENPDVGMVRLGLTLFDAKNRKLMLNGSPADLTRTEVRLLLRLAASPNETVERNRLQKEIWEDNGVIVGRSLDMFISKLRKKLEADPNTNIVVVRGKGYKLEIKPSPSFSPLF